MFLSKSLLGLLKCPMTGDELVYDQDNSRLINLKAGLIYPVIDGVPMLLESAAVKIEMSKVNQATIDKLYAMHKASSSNLSLEDDIVHENNKITEKMNSQNNDSSSVEKSRETNKMLEEA